MLKLECNNGSNIFAGLIPDQNSRGIPLTITQYKKGNNLSIGLKAELPGNHKSSLLTLCRENNIDQAPRNFGFKRNENDTNILNNYLRSINSKLDLSKLDKRIKNNVDSSLAQEFVATVRNGAFFDTWAAHLKERLKELLEPLFPQNNEQDKKAQEAQEKAKKIREEEQKYWY